MAAMKWVLLPLILHALNVQCAGMYVQYTDNCTTVEDDVYSSATLNCFSFVVHWEGMCMLQKGGPKA